MFTNNISSTSNAPLHLDSLVVAGVDVGGEAQELEGLRVRGSKEVVHSDARLPGLPHVLQRRHRPAVLLPLPLAGRGLHGRWGLLLGRAHGVLSEGGVGGAEVRAYTKMSERQGRMRGAKYKQRRPVYGTIMLTLCTTAPLRLASLVAVAFLSQTPFGRMS